MTRTFGNHESYAACEPTCADSRLSLILLIGILMVIPFVFSGYPLAAQTTGTASAQKQAPKQRFVCNVGYTRKECQVAMTILKKVTARYPVGALGEWTWVLVRTVDWKQILSDKGINPNDPAFSNLTKRVTILDGSLLETKSIRGVELRMVWNMPVEDLLDFVIRHELGHALCNERAESYANRTAIDLKNGAPLSCRETLIAEKD